MKRQTKNNNKKEKRKRKRKKEERKKTKRLENAAVKTLQIAIIKVHQSYVNLHFQGRLGRVRRVHQTRQAHLENIVIVKKKKSFCLPT